MSYDERDAAMDEMWDRMSDELRPSHIKEFTSARLRSYYVANPKIVASAFDVLGRAQELLLANHCAAALVFYLSAIELF